MSLPAEDVLNEPIFFNRQISVPLGSSATGNANGSAASRPLTPHDQPLMLAAGVTKLAHLQVALLQQHPPTFTASLQSVLTTIPPPWRAIVTAAPTAPTWQQGLSASGSQLIQNTQTGQRHSLSSHDQLQQSHAQLATATSHVHVISWDPSRPWRGPTRQPTQSAAVLYSEGQLWGPNHLSMEGRYGGKPYGHHRTMGDKLHDLAGDQEDPNRRKTCVEVGVRNQERRNQL